MFYWRKHGLRDTVFNLLALQWVRGGRQASLFLKMYQTYTDKFIFNISYEQFIFQNNPFKITIKDFCYLLERIEILHWNRIRRGYPRIRHWHPGLQPAPPSESEDLVRGCWCCPTHTEKWAGRGMNCMDEANIKLLKEAGCQQITQQIFFRIIDTIFWVINFSDERVYEI